MIVPDLPDVLAVAATVLGRDAAWVTDHCDLELISEALDDATTTIERDDPALTAATVLSGLVSSRPFPEANRRVAMAVVLHLLARNGWDLDLEPVEDVDRLLDDVAEMPRTTARLRARLRPLAHHDPARTCVKRGTMFEKYTDRARQVVVLAQEEARELKHHYIGTEHVLLGLLREGTGTAVQALDRLGVDLPGARATVENIIGHGEQAPSGHLPFTARGKHALRRATRESRELGGDVVGTEHILLGLLSEGEGGAARVLVGLGVDLARARATVQELLRRGRPPEAERAGPRRARAPWRTSKPPGQPVTGRRQVIQQELDAVFAENARLDAEVDRLRTLLRRHHIDPDQDAA